MGTVIDYLPIGLALLAAIVVLSGVAIRYERGRRRLRDAMTPEERREEEVFRKGVFRRR